MPGLSLAITLLDPRDDARGDGGGLMGDPPHEPQGWYGIFTGDTTVRLVADHAAAVARITA